MAGELGPRGPRLLVQLERIDLPGGEPGPGWAWWCPGCCSHHAVVTPPWTVTGADSERPSIVPSVVVRDGSGRVTCHSIVREGRILFLTDCTHPWAGQELPLEPAEPEPPGAGREF